jgi:hypothetical protein
MLKMPSRRLGRHEETIKLLSSSKPGVAKAIIEKGDKDLILCLSEIALNVLKGNVPLRPQHKAKLCKHKTALRTLVKKSTSIKGKRRILQRGGFLGAVLAPLLGGLASAVLPGLFGGR